MLALCVSYLLITIVDIVCIFFYDNDEKPEKN